ncbi:unnamed protein product, partial [marine sediment metagenome]
ESLGESFPEEDILAALETKVKAQMRANILERGRRPRPVATGYAGNLLC